MKPQPKYRLLLPKHSNKILHLAANDIEAGICGKVLENHSKVEVCTACLRQLDARSQETLK